MRPARGEETAAYEPGSEPTAHREGARIDRDARLQRGETIAGRFVIRSFIARGGMGEVYEAEDTALRSRVALKTLLPALAAHPESMERFRREVLLARSVAHPNVCRVFELHSTEVDGLPLHFLTMEFLEGESLGAMIKRRGHLTPAAALPLVRQMAAALDAAHAHGVVHRDFKPGNVLLVSSGTRGRSEDLRAVVTDFGIARPLSGMRQEFQTTGGMGTQEFLGTPDYAAPEQVSSRQEISEATDLFAFGVVIYQLLTGALPFAGDTPFEVAARRLTDPPRPPQALQPDLPRAWNDAILHCLEKDPARRPRSAAAVVDEIEGRSPPLRRPPRLRRSAVLGLTAVVVLAGALLIARWRRPRLAGGPGRRPVVAVLSLATQLPPSESWLGPAFTQLVSDELEEGSGLRVLPWWRVWTAYPSLRIDADQILDAEKRRRLYQLLPADSFVEGTLRCPTEPGADTCQLQLDLRDADGTSRSALQKVFPREESASAIAEFGEWLRLALGSGLGPAEQASLSARRQIAPALQKSLGQGLLAFGKLDYAAARESLEQATSLDPGFFDAQRALSHVLERQGLLNAARRVAESAANVASLSPNVRLAARARAAFLGADPQRAISEYSKLHDSHPDDVEVALDLARRVPAPDGLSLLKRTRAVLAGAPRDLLLDMHELTLEMNERHVDRARGLRARVLEWAEQLKARRELSMLLETTDPWRAEALALEAGDRQRAAYMHLLVAGPHRGQEARKIIEQSLLRFRGIADPVGMHQALVRIALTEDNWESARRALDRANAEMEQTGEPPSTLARLAGAEVALHLGLLKEARRQLELGRTSTAANRGRGSIELPTLPPRSEPEELELELLELEDRLDLAGEIAKHNSLRREAEGEDSYPGYRCWVQCLGDQPASGARCFEDLLGRGPRSNRWGRRLPECYWLAGDLEGARRAAWSSQSRTMIAAVAVADWSSGDSREGRADLERLVSEFRERSDIIPWIGADLILGTAEMRQCRSGLQQLQSSEARSEACKLWPAGRRRVEAALGEAQRRELPLLVRQARAVLRTEGTPPLPAPGKR